MVAAKRVHAWQVQHDACLSSKMAVGQNNVKLVRFDLISVAFTQDNFNEQTLYIEDILTCSKMFIVALALCHFAEEPTIGLCPESLKGLAATPGKFSSGRGEVGARLHRGVGGRVRRGLSQQVCAPSVGRPVIFGKGNMIVTI